MKRSLSLLLLLLTSLRASAATYVFDGVGFGSNVVGANPPGIPGPAVGDKLFNFDISNRIGLVAGADIRVTFAVSTFSAFNTVLVQSAGTFSDFFTVTAMSPLPLNGPPHGAPDSASQRKISPLLVRVRTRESPATNEAHQTGDA